MSLCPPLVPHVRLTRQTTQNPPLKPLEMPLKWGKIKKKKKKGERAGAQTEKMDKACVLLVISCNSVIDHGAATTSGKVKRRASNAARRQMETEPCRL